MAKLPQDVAKATKEAEDGFTLMEEGDYVVVLDEVQTEKNGKPTVGKESGVPYWTWIFSIPKLDENGEKNRYGGRKFWRVISLGETSAGIRKAAYAAFGGDPETSDTDDFIGKSVLAHVGTKMNDQVGSASYGQESNEIQRLMPLEKDGGKATTKKGDKAKPDMF